MATLRQSREIEQSEIFYVRTSIINQCSTFISSKAKNRSLYIGYSADLRKRLVVHNKNQVISTKDKTPWKLIYYEAYLERKDASGRERFLKSGAGWRFIKKQLKYHFTKK